MKEGWEYKKLGEVADFCRGLTYKREDEVDSSDNCVLRSNNIDLESMSLNFEELKYIRPDFVIPEDKKLKANSVFVCMSNGSKQHVGKVAYVNEDMNYAFGGFMGLIVPKPQVRGKYIYYVCRSSLFRHFLDQIGNGIGITNLRFSDLNEFSIPFPSLSEQQHIVEELDLLSSIIEKKKAQLNELDNLAQSLFYEMFGDPITNEKGWEVRKLNDIYKLKSGDGLSAKNFVEGIYPVYGGNGISGYHNAYNMNGDFIIIGRVGAYCGNVRYVKGLFWLTDNAFQLFFDANIQTPVFVLYLLKLLDLHRFANEAAQPVISNKTLRDLDIIIPTMEMQEQFASKIEAIEHQKELIKQSIKEVETLFNSRMDYYFN